MTERLDVLYDGIRVAELVSVGLNAGASLRYTEEAIESHGTGTPLLSVRLPIRKDYYPAAQTKRFLEGLLPEDHVRASLADRARVAVEDTFALLRAYGLDCAGAIQIVDPNTVDSARKPDIEWLDSPALAKVVAGLPSAPLGIGIGPGVRTSLGGLQGKLTVVVDGDRIGVPLDGTPSTHILKPARLMGDGTEQWPGIPAAEVFGMRLVQACHTKGVSATSAEAKVVGTGENLAILVTRFDRKVSPDGSVHRIHQEDFGQALGVAEKYQYDPFSPPRLIDAARLIQDHATFPTVAMQELLEMLTINMALGNCDMHIRNISLLLDRGEVQLTPAYDVVPTSVWQDHPTSLSLYVGGEAFLADIGAESLLREAESWGMRAPVARRVIARTVEAAAASLDELMDCAVDEGWHHPILDLVSEQTGRRLTILNPRLTS